MRQAIHNTPWFLMDSYLEDFNFVVFFEQDEESECIEAIQSWMRFIHTNGKYKGLLATSKAQAVLCLKNQCCVTIPLSPTT